MVVFVAFLSISEFARATGFSVSALRFYDSVGLITPALVDEVNGYRRYSADQIDAVVLIRDLRRLEMPITGIRSLLAATPEVRHELLDRHLGTLTSRLRELEVLAGAVRSSLDKEGSVSSMTVSAIELAEAIDQVAPAAGCDPERPLLQTILVEARDGSLRLVGTDSYRLAVRDLVAHDGRSVSFRALVAAARLVRARDELPDAGDLELSLSGQNLRVSTSGNTIELRVVPAQYPDYESLFTVDPAASSFTAERVGLCESLASLQQEKRVALQLGESGVRLEGRPVVVTEPWTGPDMTVVLDPRYFSDAVNAAVGPEVRAEITTALNPVLFRAATDGSFVCLVMPIKLD